MVITFPPVPGRFYIYERDRDGVEVVLLPKDNLSGRALGVKARTFNGHPGAGTTCRRMQRHAYVKHLLQGRKTATGQPAQ